MVQTDCIDLLTLQRLIREGLEDMFPEAVWISAEVAQIQLRQNGHCYLDLVQSAPGGCQVAKAKAIIWASRYHSIAGKFEDATGSPLCAGTRILARVRVNYSELYSVSLVIDAISPEFSLGESEMRRRETVDLLRKEGLLDRQQSLSLPPLARNLAVISAEDAAGFGDFKRHIEENEYGFTFKVDLFPATMQGLDAPDSIMEALRRIDGYDAVLIMRGGGSALDLACFDDRDLAREIALFPIPVFTAIGHDRDYHIADMVAFRFVKTPTALADEFISLLQQQDEKICLFASRIRLSASNRLSRETQRISSLSIGIRRSIAGKITLGFSEIRRLEEKIRGADPRLLLERGYALACDSGGGRISGVGAVGKGDRIRIVFSDGEIGAIVEDIRNNGQ